MPDVVEWSASQPASMRKDLLLPNSVVGWVGYSGAVDVLRKGKIPCPHQKSNTGLSCPYHRHWTDCVIYSHWRSSHNVVCTRAC